MTDSTSFIRAKLATTYKFPSSGHFDTDGFDKWAASGDPEFYTGHGKRSHQLEQAMSERRHTHHKHGGFPRSATMAMHSGHQYVASKDGHGAGGSVKDTIEEGIKVWKDTPILGKPLSQWSSIPNAIKDFVNKAIGFFDLVKQYAPEVKSALEKLATSGVPGADNATKVVDTIKMLGFGRRELKLLHKHFEVVHKAMKEHSPRGGSRFVKGLHNLHTALYGKKGGDAFDDKVKSITLGSTAVSAAEKTDLGKKAISAARAGYNFYDTAKKQAPAIKDAISTYVPAPAKDKILSAIAAVGLGRRHRKGRGAFEEVGEEHWPEHRPEHHRRTGHGGAMSERHQLVSKLMRERGLSLPEASKAVKAEGLW